MERSNSSSGYLFIIFDIPTEDAKLYNRFRKSLISKGFIQAQKSFYYKYLDNLKQYKYIIINLKKELPKTGNIMAIKLTKNQFDDIIYLLGEELNPSRDNIIII